MSVTFAFAPWVSLSYTSGHTQLAERLGENEGGLLTGERQTRWQDRLAFSRSAH